ncbi:MAG: hypothetical protein ACK5CA_09800 [Cyanobacteriota bacterium]
MYSAGKGRAPRGKVRRRGRIGTTCAQLLAGIHFTKALINMYLREKLTRESVVYQGIAAALRSGGRGDNG